MTFSPLTHDLGRILVDASGGGFIGFSISGQPYARTCSRPWKRWAM
jgi:hypothetical protein